MTAGGTGIAALLLAAMARLSPLGAQAQEAGGAAARTDSAVVPGPAAPAAAPPERRTAVRRLMDRTAGLEVWGGLASESPQWGILGETPRMRYGQLALRWSRALGAAADAAAVRWEWTVDLVPFARMSPPLRSLRGTGAPCAKRLCVLPPRSEDLDGFPPHAPVGIGIAPVGVTRRFVRGGRVSPFLGVTGGGLWFDQRVPTTQASRFNFTASAEAGVRLGPPTERGLTVSYRFHHISNAGTAGENPGLASHLVAVGVHLPRRRARD